MDRRETTPQSNGNRTRYISADGTLHHTPQSKLRLSYITQLFWSVLGFFYIFFNSIFPSSSQNRTNRNQSTRNGHSGGGGGRGGFGTVKKSGGSHNVPVGG
eukprot:TRINITY_DN1331_c0_g1_i1.p1 TRINITY_DN1331_c0_g1~~TRINITY_DN1331_c0_g1_i1.p1  ORF type:complete len:101 (-),score=8.26 TRINITY_DN1331_c0_g1_i1:214-516(-)